MLNSETNTPAMERRIKKAALVRFGCEAKPVFEHGQWWVTFGDGSQYSVCDAEPGGFYFEQVTAADEE